MKKNKKGISLIEAIVVVTILAIGVVAVFSFFSKSRSLLDGIGGKIEAIEIAREGIEGLENIRNTNWLRFPGNTKSCWNVFNYNKDCILNESPSIKIDKLASPSKNIYILSTDENGVWYLESKIDGDYRNITYRDNFGVFKNANGNYCQKLSISGVIFPICNEKVIGNYVRKIIIEKTGNIIIDSSGNPDPNGQTDKMLVRSIVQWTDSSSSLPRKVEIVNLLTNYK